MNRARGEETMDEGGGRTKVLYCRKCVIWYLCVSGTCQRSVAGLAGTCSI